MPTVRGAEDRYLLSRGHSYYIFALLFLLYMFDYIDRMVVVSLFPYLKADFGLSDTHCGLLVSTVYWSIVVLSVPISVIIDRWSRKKSIGLMAIFWSLATVACAFTKTFPQLFIARTAIGVGEAGYAPGGTAMISAFFPEKIRSSIVGLWTAALPLGSAVGIMLGGYIAARYGWRNAFGIVALPGFVVAVLFLFGGDYQTVKLGEKTDTGPRQAAKPREIIRRFARTPSLLLTYVAFAGSMFLTAAYLSWLPTYYHRVENLPMEKAAFKGSLVMLLAIVGFPLGGFLVDRWRKTRITARLLFPALSSVITGAVFLLAFSSMHGDFQYALVLLGGIGASAFSPAAIAVTQDVVHPGLRATSYSFCVLSQNLLGSSLGPLFVGAISDRYGIHYALTLVPLFSFFAAALYFAASFFYEADLARVEKIPLDPELRFQPEAGRV